VVSINFLVLGVWAMDHLLSETSKPNMESFQPLQLIRCTDLVLFRLVIVRTLERAPAIVVSFGCCSWAAAVSNISVYKSALFRLPAARIYPPNGELG
jgi:hypothetical protein